MLLEIESPIILVIDKQKLTDTAILNLEVSLSTRITFVTSVSLFTGANTLINSATCVF